MGILDDAIKEHLELKRQHGADASELAQLEDEAFGAAERPGGDAPAPDPAADAATQLMTQPEAEEPSSRPAPRAEIADLQEAPPSAPAPDEREAIGEQPTEMYDVEEELASSEAPAPSEEDLVEEEMEEPRLAPVDPLSSLDDADVDAAEVADSGTAEEEYEEDDDFWDEKRLSDELDQALEAPSEVEVEEVEHAEVTEVEDEPEAADEPEPEADAQEQPPARTDEDVLEETPDFLEETPEDDELWFEQKPPKDFDFDD
jgi:hypothetical protein